MDEILFGAAYYDEYMPKDADRIQTDIEMMHEASINVVRIAESTWSTLEPQPGVYDFSHIDRALEAMHAAGIKVIVGTPTYAVPAWLAATYPEVIATTPSGRGKYGARQNMNIAHPAYRFHAERVIRVLMEHVAQHPAVIGYQVDNESKYYDTASNDVQRRFVKWLRDRFDNDLDALNEAYGLAYWSNRIDAWEDFPDVTGTINGSLGSAFDEFRRTLVDEFLTWQADLVREYKRDDQFITHNFDFDWGPGWSYGLQPAVNHFHAAKAVDVAGVDIYHPTESRLSGKEIAFGGDMTRSIKDGENYLVLETQAQGQNGWLPYPGQLRLQAWSHLASGASSVMYWHWHSIHNSFETYWKGLLSQDFSANPTYLEAGVFGAEVKDHADRLVGLRKQNKVAIMVSNEALTALKWFRIETGFPFGESIGYNDVLRWVYDAMFELNVEVDFVSPEDEHLDRYQMLVVPALYTCPQATIDRIRAFVEEGGHLVSTFRSFVTDENVKVWTDRAPHGLRDVLGVGYDQFTRPDGVPLALSGALADSGITAGEAQKFMELLVVDDAEVLAGYDHYAWAGNAAITRKAFGKGTATHIGTMGSSELVREVLRLAAEAAGVLDWSTELAGTVCVRRGTNAKGQELVWLLNYSAEEKTLALPFAGTNLLTGEALAKGSELTIGRWDLALVVR